MNITLNDENTFLYHADTCKVLPFTLFCAQLCDVGAWCIYFCTYTATYVYE